MLLEAMASGTPMCISRVPPMPEIAGNASVYFDPHDADDIAHSVNELLSNPELRLSLSENGRERVKQFPWSKSAQTVVSVLKRIAGESGSL